MKISVSDILQLKPVMFSAAADQFMSGFVDLAVGSKWVPPFAVLPLFPDEKTLAGPEAQKLRRGSGGSWPYECQFPVNDDPENGVGRIPLVLAMMSLLPDSGSEWETIDSHSFCWKLPAQKNALCSDAAGMIVDFVRSKNNKKESHTANILVIPDRFNEFSQQCLLDKYGLEGEDYFRLIPRPMAIAAKWCFENRCYYTGHQATEDPEGQKVGFLRVIHLGLDEWEFHEIEVRKRLHKGEIWLFPIRNREPGKNYEMPFCGLDFLFHFFPPAEKNDPQKLWKYFFCQSYIRKNFMKYMNTYLERIFSRDFNALAFADTFNKFELFRPFAEQRKRKVKDNSGSSLSDFIDKKSSRVRSADNHDCLGNIICGSLAELKWTENGETLADFLADKLKIAKGNLIKGDANEAALGALYTEQAIRNKLPVYRDTLVGIDIHTIVKDEKGDDVIKWRELVRHNITVEAGQRYEEPSITGFHIESGEKELALFLRRKLYSGIMRDSYEYRKIKAELDEDTRKKEPVVINTEVRPGQGHARAYVQSEEEGIFETRLDWKKMEKCSAPKPPQLSYMKGVANIRHSPTMFRSAIPYMKEICEMAAQCKTQSTGKPKRLDYCLSKLRDCLNTWIFNDTDSSDGRMVFDAVFGVSVYEKELPSVAKDFLSAMEYLYVNFEEHRKISDDIMRCAGWCYDLTPGKIKKCVSGKLALNSSNTVIQVAGLTFREDGQMKNFFKLFSEKCRQGAQNIDRPSIYWFRAFRNIVRLNEHAMSKKVIKDDDLFMIVHEISEVMKEYLTNHGSSFLLESVRSLFYVLKRRRYDENFLQPPAVNGPIKGRSDNLHYYEIFCDSLEKIVSNSIRGRALYLQSKATLNFLKKEGSSEDLIGFLRSDK